MEFLSSHSVVNMMSAKKTVTESMALIECQRETVIDNVKTNKQTKLLVGQRWYLFVNWAA